MHPVKKIAAAAIACGLFAGTQAALADTVSHAAEGVTRVRFGVPGELTVRRASEEKLTIEAEGKVLKNLEVAIKGDTLSVSGKGSFSTDKPLRFVLTLKSIKALQHEGSGNVAVQDFAGAQMQFEGGGSGDLRLMNLNAGKLTLALKGSGNIEASGSGRQITIRLDGTGNVDASRFRAQTAEARIDGAGTIRLHADDSLKAVVNGSGNIEYLGKAKVTQSVTGAGSVDRL